MGGLLLPVGSRRMSSWASHQRRSPRSSEPGTDFYCPIGTPIYSPADGVVYGSGNSIAPATGRWVGIDLDNGMRFRCMHLSRMVNLPRRVKRGQLIGYSGASGYGKENWENDPHTGGAHTHVTLWPTHASRFGYDRNGKPYTVDFMAYADNSSPASAGGSSEEDDMNDDDRNKLNFVYAALAGPVNLGVEKTVWARPFGEKAGEAYYGMFDVLLNVQATLAKQAGVLAALQAALAQVAKSGAVIDMKAIEAAAERGAKDVLSGLVLKADVND